MEYPAKSIKSFFFKNIFVLSLAGLGLISLALLLTRHQAEFAVNILEALLMGYSVAAYLWTRNERITAVVAIRWSSFLYVVFSYLYAVSYRHANVLDFLMIYKSFVYLFFLTFLVNKKLMPFLTVNWLGLTMFALFMLKYILLIGLGIEPRPILFMENNFELMFIYTLYLIRYSVNKEKYLHLLFVVGVITVLSLSRASLLMYSVLVLFVIYDSFKKTRVFIIPSAILVLGVIVYYIFAQRAQSLEEIDRYRFMLVWWGNVKDWTLSQWMVGAERVTPLSEYSCHVMSYFKNLFSFSNNGTCYSVILHSFLFRVLYDHGILGLIFIIYATFTLLQKSRLRMDVILVFIAVVLINGLSVSSFNNLFFAISMVFLMSTNLDFPDSKENTGPEEGVLTGSSAQMKFSLNQTDR